MARIMLTGGPAPGPMTTPTPLPPPYIDAKTGHGVHRYLRTEEVDGNGRIIYVTGEMVLAFGELPAESE